VFSCDTESPVIGVLPNVVLAFMVSEVNSEFRQAKGPNPLVPKKRKTFVFSLFHLYLIIFLLTGITEYLSLRHTRVLATCKKTRHLYRIFFCRSLSSTGSRFL
jgi:hypothetical protein